MKMSNVKFLWTGEHIQSDSEAYWMRVLDIATKHSIPRMRKCTQIMGRDENDEKLSVAQFLYPCMQATDVFFLKTDICQLGTDQRKVNMLARDYISDHYKNDKVLKKPVVLSNIMIPGLKEGCFKMSKSDPDNAIFMEDTKKEVEKKINGAFCPIQVLFENPVIVWFQYFI
jgi:tyrosyl-tRNA synthetase